VVIAALSAVAYAFIASTYRSIVAPALETPEGRAGFALAMRAPLYAIVATDAFLLLAVGLASYALARAALRPLARAREREERFASEAAHELRTPLAAIASLAESAAPDAPAPERAAFEAIARRALDCGDLVGDLLTLARASGADALEREIVDVSVVVRRCIRDVGHVPLPAIDATLDGALVYGDERRLRQLVRNLLDNAFAHARERIAVRVISDNGDARLSVEDDGPGVAPDIEGRLFERFAKGRASAGSGLGLALCRWIAQAHGGSIAFEGGSRFVVRLPLADAPATDVP